MYEYDNNTGRLVRSVEWVESAWDEEQRGWMLALAEYEAGLCACCGGDPAVCQSPDADRNNPRATYIYWPLPPNECNIGTALKVGEKEFGNPAKALVPRVVRARRGDPRPMT